MQTTKLESIQITNYKSIDDLKLDFPQNEDESYTYGMIGINEAGKSNILQSISLLDNKESIDPSHYRNKNLDVVITTKYKILNSTDIIKTIESDDLSGTKVYEIESEGVIAENIFVRRTFNKISSSTKKETIVIFNQKEYYGEEFILKDSSLELIEKLLHKTIFWSYDKKYLINSSINLQQFISNPDAISVPLKNCFKLAGYNNLTECYKDIAEDSINSEEVSKKLSSAVTQHIKSVWKNHPIEITFPISGDTINFHITDLNSDSKAKKTNQRSDGFKQFISFLLTISAEKVQGELTNKIILLNEPETHLHPQAQIDFLKEMCELTKKGNNLLLYSTHSNHLIDRKNITKMLRVNKVGDKTDVQKIKGNSFSYARVNYEVFNIATTDYHNELYGLLYQRAIDDETESSLNIKEFDSNYFVTKLKQAKKHPWKAQANQVSLHTYIRNCIHHPENPDYKFSVEDLESSVGFLHSLVWQSSAVKP